MEQNPRDPNKNTGGNNPAENKKVKGIWVSLIFTVVIVLIISLIYNSVVDSQFEETTFSDFLTEMENGNLYEVEFHADRVYYLTVTEAEKPANEQVACYTGLPSGDVLTLSRELDALGVTVSEAIVEDNSGIIMIMYYVIMFALIFVMMRSLTKRMSGDGMMGSFGKSKAKVYMEKQTGEIGRAHV